METIKTIKGKDLKLVFNTLNQLLQINTQPFSGQALILAYKLQNELEAITKMSEEHRALLLDAEFSFNVVVPIPEVYGLEHERGLELICGELPKKETQAEKLIKDLTEK